jgi:ABC-type multidrug transport system ATPase subunit
VTVHSRGSPRGCPEAGDKSPAIQTKNLTRRFHTFNAVDNLNLSISRGEIYGFLGSNGAGKTTTMKMLVGLLEPSAGQVWIAGYDVWAEPLAAKAASGYVADRAILYERLTGREFLTFLGQMRGIPLFETRERIEHLLDLLELTEHADRPCGTYSFGMKRKLALAGALLHQPQVLILDEPLNGLDPRSARCLKDLFIELASAGTTILLSTHDLATAEAVCHRAGIIHHGRLLVEGNPIELKQMATAPDLEAVFLDLTAEKQEEVAL